MGTSYRVTAEMWRVWTETQQTIPGVRLGGIYANKRYYHSSVNENLAKWAPNYSIRVSLDLNGGNKDKARAIDLTMSDAEMRKRTRYLRDSALDPDDDRLYGMREFYGTLDGRTVYGLSKDDEDGPWKFSSSDSSHFWHIHAAEFAAFVASWKALSGFVSVVSGESLAAWRKRTGGASLPASGVPSGTYREGDTGSGVERIQAALNEALGAGLVEDGIFGPATTAAVKDLQRRAGLTVDGIYGPDTAGALRELLEEDDMVTDEDIEKISLGVWRYTNEQITSRDAYAQLRASDGVLEVKADAAAARKTSEAILAKVAGADTKTILTAIQKAAVEDAARDTVAATALAEIAALVAQVGSGELAADAVVDLIAERLSPTGGE